MFDLSLWNVQTLNEFLGYAEAEVRSLASLYSSVVCIEFILIELVSDTCLQDDI